MSGAATNVFIGGYVTNAPTAFGMYVAQKRGTTYDFWAFDGIGASYWLGSTTFSSTLAYMGFEVHDATWAGTKQGNAIFYADFIRLAENTSVFLP